MNANYLFNVEYYKELSYSHFGECNARLVEQRWEPSEIEPVLFTEDSFILKTVYPGLLLGLGYVHEVGKEYINGDIEDGADIKLGFSFDFVTGLPVIPGSTVKGVLRSAFVQYGEYVADILGIRADQISSIENEVFGKNNMGKVVFFDAIPVKANKDGRILGLENITPHNTEENDGLVNPKPLTLVKVIPGVCYLFRFGFGHWSNDEQGFKKDDLVRVFKQILMDYGVGAKTNVGFGILEEPEDNTILMRGGLVPVISDLPKAGTEPVQPQQGFSPGECRVCGVKTGINPKTGLHHEYCYEHNPDLKRK